MRLSNDLLKEIRELQRKPSEWFSLEEIGRQDPNLLLTRFIKNASGEQISVPYQPTETHRKLDDWAARLLEREVRGFESRIAEFCTQNSVIPDDDDDDILVRVLSDYVHTAVEEIRGTISAFTQYKESDWLTSWSKLQKTGKALASEVSITVPLAGEIARLEVIDSGFEPLDRIGFSQTKIERFYSQYSNIPHPFDSSKRLKLPQDTLSQAIHLLIFVVFHQVKEPRLSGFENKFVSAFRRYLTCPRDSSSSSVIDQVTALFEPFLKKLSFLFDVNDVNGKPIWMAGLDGLIGGLHLTSGDLKKTDPTYWQSQTVEDAIFRIAYQLRHKGAHEAHEYAYFERERNAYFIFAALLLSCKTAMTAKPEILKAIAQQIDVESIRDLFVKIDELIDSPEGPRRVEDPQGAPSRFAKLLSFSHRAEAIWPTCSSDLAESLLSEYFAVKDEFTEADREASIQSYVDDMANGF